MKFKQQIEFTAKPRPIGIIGAGGIVKDAHLPAYKMGNFPILGIYDIDCEKTAILKRQFNIIGQVYKSLPALIEDTLANNGLFDIAVPAGQVYDILLQIPEGAAVLIQKPMGENLKEAKKILNLCIDKKFVSGINFQLRYAPYMIAAQQIIAQGLIGDVYDMEFKVCVFTPWNLWDFLNTAPRVEILYHSIHYIDLIRSMVGNPVKMYASTVKHPKILNLAATRSTIILDYEKELQARIITNHGHEFGLKNQESYFKIEGTKGAIKIRIGLSLDYPKGMPPHMEYIQLDGASKWKEVPLEGAWFPHAFMNIMSAFQQYIKGNNKHSFPSTNDAYETMRLVELAYLSSEKGGIKI